MIFFMMKRIKRFLTVSFLILSVPSFIAFFTSAISAQKDSKKFNLSVPFKKCWSYQSKIVNYLASDNINQIIVSTSENKLLALEINSGSKLWETEPGGEIDFSFASDEKNIYVITNSKINNEKTVESPNNRRLISYADNINDETNKRNSVKLRSIDRHTGITNWQVLLSPVNAKPGYKLVVASKSNQVIVVDQSGVISAFNKTDGKTLWRKNLNLEQNNILDILQDERVVFANNNRIVVTDIENGERVFENQIDSMPSKVYSFNENFLALGNKKGEIITLNTKTKKTVWKFRAGAEISNISLTSKGLLATSFDNFVYLIKPEDGNLIWKRRLEGRLIIEPYIIGEHIIVMTPGSSRATILDLNDGKPINQIYLAAGDYFISRPFSNGKLILFPTSDRMSAFTNQINDCTVS